ncbi:MAG: hypothetical protein EON55_20745, partial [Alphaproteobacteria bacterium]
GETFLAEARLTIGQLERTERIGRRAGNEEAGPLRVGYVFSAALSGTLDRAITVIRSTFPDIEIHAEPMETPEQIEALSAGRLDLGFHRPRARYPATLRTHIVNREPLMLFMSSSDLLASDAAIMPASSRKPCPAALCVNSVRFRSFYSREGCRGSRRSGMAVTRATVAWLRG